MLSHGGYSFQSKSVTLQVQHESFSVMLSPFQGKMMKLCLVCRNLPRCCHMPPLQLSLENVFPFPRPLFFLFLLDSPLVSSSSITSSGNACFDSHLCAPEFHLPRPLILLFPCWLSPSGVLAVQRGPGRFSTPQGCTAESRELSSDALHSSKDARGIWL